MIFYFDEVTSYDFVRVSANGSTVLIRGMFLYGWLKLCRSTGIQTCGPLLRGEHKVMSLPESASHACFHHQ